MKIKAELKRCGLKKVNLDNVYEMVFVTDNPNAVDYGKLPADTLFELGISLVDDNKGVTNG